jgi:small subunit ribosomal protein S8
MLTDPIADMITRIRNAYLAGQPSTRMDHSNLKSNIAQVLQDLDYIAGYQVEGSKPKQTLIINLKYTKAGQPAITGIKRHSKPGLRVYCKAGKYPPVLGGLGVNLVSTSQGVMTHLSANRRKLGGEVLIQVW